MEKHVVYNNGIITDKGGVNSRLTVQIGLKVGGQS